MQCLIKLAVLTLISVIVFGYTRDAEYHNVRGIEYGKSGKTSLAVEEFTKAIMLDPNESRYFINRCNAYNDLDENKLALKDCNEAIRLGSRDSLAYLNRANAYDLLGEYEKAIEDYEEAIHLDPRNPKHFRNRAITQVRLREYQLALNDLNHAINLEKDYVLAYISRALVHAAVRHFKLAANDYSEWVKLTPSTPPELRAEVSNIQSSMFFDAEVIKTSFVTIEANGKESIEITDRVVLSEGQSYGWIMQLSTPNTKVRWREEFWIPQKPETWGSAKNNSDSSIIDESGQISVTEREDNTGENGIVSHFWKVAKSDPSGVYIINVYIGDKLIRPFIFRVER